MSWLSGFANAFAGVVHAVRSERNLQIQLVVLVLVLTFGFYFRLAEWEWAAVILSSGLVISMELVNSSVEELCDFVSPALDGRIRNIKDMAAGAVLIASIAAFSVGLIIFAKYFFE